MSTIDILRGILERDHALPAERLVPEATLDDLGLDSLATIEMLWNVEEEFGIEVPSEPVPLETLGDVAGYVDSLVAAQSAPGDAVAEEAGTASGPAPPPGA